MKKLIFFSFYLLVFTFLRSQDTVYFCDFDHPSDTAGWQFVNGTETNHWAIGLVYGLTGGGLCVSAYDDGPAYSSHSPSVTYACRNVVLPQGVCRVEYDWSCRGVAGEAFMRVFLAPSTARLTAGELPTGLHGVPVMGVPAGWQALDGGAQLGGVNTWQRYAGECYIEESDTFMLVFMWFNSYASYATNPPGIVDNVLVTQPYCPQPGQVYADRLTDTSFALHWSDWSNYRAAYWLVELDSASQAYGQGTVYSTVDTQMVFSNLAPNAEYRVYVRTVCVPDTGSVYNDTTDTVSVRVRTCCRPLRSLPYVEDFEGVGGEWLPCWQKMWSGGSVSVCQTWLGSVRTKSLCWNPMADAYQYVVLPGVEVDGLSTADLQLSFRCRESAPPYSHRFEVGVMSDPLDRASFVPVGTVVVGTDAWEECVVEMLPYRGEGIYIALRSLARAMDVGIIRVMMDDFVIDRAVPCQSVRRLEVGAVGTTGALLSWTTVTGTTNTPGTFEVKVDVVDTSADPPTAPSAAALPFVSSVPQCMLNSLAPQTTYRAWVRAQCANDSLSEWDSICFTTVALPCVAADTSMVDTVQCDSGAYTVMGVPVSNYYVHSLCQSIYTADELLAAGAQPGVITGLDYTFTSCGHDMMFSIYAASTAAASYASTADLLAVEARDRVYGPTVHATGTSGRVHYAFDRPLSWDGASNIVVTTMMNNATSEMLSAMFGGHSTPTGANRTVYSYLNEEPFDVANYATGNAALSQYRPTVAMYMQPCAEVATCVAPTVVVGQVEADGAYLGWIAGNGETAWDVLYRLADDTSAAGTGWTVADTNVGTTYYYLGLLQPTSRYVVRVVPRCTPAPGQPSVDGIYTQVEFTTQCAPIATLPWVEDFEGFEAPSNMSRPIEACWYRWAGRSNINVSSTYAHGGQQSLFMGVQTTTGFDNGIATPEMGMDVSQLQVSFYAFDGTNYAGNPYSLKVGVMEDPTDPSTFVEVARVTPSEWREWEEKEVPLDGYTGDGRYIVLMLDGDAVGGVYIDDLTVDIIPLCQRPRNVTVEAVTRSSAVVQWDGRRVRNYEVEYGPAGFAPGTGTVLTTVLDGITLTGLSHSTIYEVYVRGICGEDTSADSYAVTFATLCGEIDRLPYTQNFGYQGVGSDARPFCWVCGGEYVRAPSIEATSYGNGRSLYMPGYFNRSYAIMPAVDTVRYPMQSLQVAVVAHSGGYYSSSSESHDLIVGICHTNGDLTSFTPVDTVACAPMPTVYEIPLTGAVGLGEYIAFVSVPTGHTYTNTVYLDSVAVVPVPSCLSPYGLSATSPSSTTAHLRWQSRGTASRWQVEYMPQGTPIGTGTRIIATNPSLTLTGLTPNTAYDFYVRSVCGIGDTSVWSYAPGYFVTQQIPATVPYFYDFDSVDEWNRWQTLSNTSVSWYRGIADGQPAPCIYLSADSGATRSTITTRNINAVVYRDIDFGTVDTSFVLSFSASVGGLRQYNYFDNYRWDGMAVFLVDPTVTPMPTYDIQEQSPWGQIDTLTLLADIQGDGATEWSDYSFVLDSIHGIHRLVFYSYGASAIVGDTYIGAPAAVDNLSIQYPPCQRPYSLRATDVTAGTATIRWHGSVTADYRVRLYDVDETLLADDTVHTNLIQYSSLIPATTYRVRVGRLCDSLENPSVTAYTFSTASCAGSVADTIGNPVGAVSHYEIPIHTSYTYSYTQQIIRASELQGRGEITGIGFLYTSIRVMTVKTNCTIYLGHTTLNSFSSASDYVSPADLEPVYIGNLNCFQGWNRVLLGSPFAYNGTDNLVIAIDDNSGQRHNSNFHFATAATPYPMALAYFGYDNVDCSSSDALSGYDGVKELLNYRNVISVEMCPPNGCPSPQLLAPRVRANDVTLRWRQGGGDRYLFGYRRADSDRWILDNIPTTDTFYTVDRFVFGDDYVYHVRQYCDSANVSNWALGSFNTAIIPCLPPEGLHTTDATNHSAHLEWTPDDNHISYHLHVWGSGIDTTLTTYVANATLDGLNPASRYYASVEVQCEYVSEPSEWSDTITFETTVCPDVTGLTALDVQGNSVLLDWDDNEETESWLIEWGLQGFDQGTGVLVAADHHPFLLTGLTGETTYDIVVRAVCGDDYYSEAWSPRLTLTTAYSGIETDELSTLNSQFSIFPNPTTGDVMLTLPTGIGALRVEVVDMAGRQCLKVSMGIENGDGNCLNELIPDCLSAGAPRTQAIKQSNNQAITTTLPTRTLPAGAYYVRLTSDRFSAVRKLLKIEN